MQFNFKHFRRDINQWSILISIIGLFIAIPAIAIFYYFFQGVGEMWGHIRRNFLSAYILNSIALLLGAGLLSFLLGVSSAWIVANYRFPFRRWIEWLLFLPLAIPSYIVAYTYVGLFGNGGSFILLLQELGVPIQKIEFMNLFGLIWVLAFSLFPYVYVGAKTMFETRPASVRDSCNLLGVSRRQFFWKVGLPLALPGIIGGLLLVFMEVLNDYGAAKYFGVNTFTTGIFRAWTGLEDLQSAIWLSAILVLLVLLMDRLVKWLIGKRSYALKLQPENQGQLKKEALKGRKRVLYLSILSIPLLFGLILPVTQLLYWGLLTFKDQFSLDLLLIALESLFLGVVGAGFIVMVSLLLVNWSKWNHFRVFEWLGKFGVIGYVLPGAIIGIGILRSSQAIIQFFDHQFGLKIGFLFFSSSVVLI
ncbi:MAG: ABC transporter permease subunit [Bacteroidota bacterium]